jgi:hypothetical protein
MHRSRGSVPAGGVAVFRASECSGLRFKPQPVGRKEYRYLGVAGCAYATSHIQVPPMARVVANMIDMKR